MAHGKDSVFWLDNTSTTLTNITTKVTNITGLPGSVDLAENTTHGSESKTYEPGLGDATIQVECVWDAALSAILGTKAQWKAATRSFEYGPEGGTGSDVKHYGECWIQNVDIPAPVGDIVKATITLQVDGDISLGDFS